MLFQKYMYLSRNISTWKETRMNGNWGLRKKKKRKKKYAIIYVILFYNFYYEWNYMEMEKCIMIHLCSNEKNLNFIGNFISV